MIIKKCYLSKTIPTVTNQRECVYLGSEMNELNKKQLIDLVNDGNFNPGIWVTSLAKSTFSLEFTQVG